MKIVCMRQTGTQNHRFGTLANCGQLVHVLPDAADWETALRQANTGECLEPTVKLQEVELLAPVPNPQKIVCVGKNYAQHAREMGSEPPELPVIFNKLSLIHILTLPTTPYV